MVGSLTSISHISKTWSRTILLNIKYKKHFHHTCDKMLLYKVKVNLLQRNNKKPSMVRVAQTAKMIINTILGQSTI